MTEIYLKATKEHGVEVINSIDYPELELMKPYDFKDMVPNLDEDEIIFTAVMPKGTDGVYEELLTA